MNTAQDIEAGNPALAGELAVIEFGDGEPEGQVHVSRARGQNFLVERIRFGAAGGHDFSSPHETMIIAPDVTLTLDWNGATQTIAPRALAILPAGKGRLSSGDPGQAFVLRPAPQDAPEAANARDYARPIPGIRPPGPSARRIAAPGVQVIHIDDVQAPRDKPRLKMLRTADLSINWVEYDGPRDRRTMSPHSHADFEQGSLAVRGRFIHHLRVPWGPDMNDWREDMHRPVGDATLAVIPPGMIHTTEGIGEEPHLLIDVFCPAREDFLANGWIVNAADYAAGAD